MDHMMLYMILAGIFGLFMAWGIGANDVANAMATSVGAKAVTIKQALIIAAVFEFAGAVIAGGSVTKTIRKGMIDTASIMDQPELLVFGMLASLLAAGIWLLIASRKGWPVSTTHSIVGAIVGFAAVGIGMEAVKWDKIGTIVISWVVSPLTAGFIAYLLFRSVQATILETDDPLQNAKRYVPAYIFLAGFTLTLVTIMKGLKHLGLDLSQAQCYSIAVGIGLVLAMVGKFFISKLQFDETESSDFGYASVEKVFGVLMIVTACGMAFAHGSNDVANAIGPVAAIYGVLETGAISQTSSLPLWMLALGGAGIVIGLATLGHKVIATVGEGITQLTPSRGFAAELAAATTVVVASNTGIPISTTHTLVGAVLGVGFARGIAALNLNVIRTIFLSWIVTLPAGAFLSIIFFTLFRAMWG